MDHIRRSPDVFLPRGAIAIADNPAAVSVASQRERELWEVVSAEPIADIRCAGLVADIASGFQAQIAQYGISVPLRMPSQVATAESVRSQGASYLGFSGVSDVVLRRDGWAGGHGQPFHVSRDGLRTVFQMRNLSHELYHFFAPYFMRSNGDRVFPVPLLLEEGSASYFASASWNRIVDRFRPEARDYAETLQLYQFDGRRANVFDHDITGMAVYSDAVLISHVPYFRPMKIVERLDSLHPQFFRGVEIARFTGDTRELASVMTDVFHDSGETFRLLQNRDQRTAMEAVSEYLEKRLDILYPPGA